MCRCQPSPSTMLFWKSKLSKRTSWHHSTTILNLYMLYSKLSRASTESPRTFSPRGEFSKSVRSSHPPALVGYKAVVTLSEVNWTSFVKADGVGSSPGGIKYIEIEVKLPAEFRSNFETGRIVEYDKDGSILLRIACDFFTAELDTVVKSDTLETFYKIGSVPDWHRGELLPHMKLRFTFVRTQAWNPAANGKLLTLTKSPSPSFSSTQPRTPVTIQPCYTRSQQTYHIEDIVAALLEKTRR